MDDEIDAGASAPVFKKCVRCSYSLRGLPANHACPECGLRFDERCELYRATNPRQVVLIWGAILGGGWVVLKHLPHLSNFSAASVWDKIGALAAVAWLFFVGFAVWLLIRRYRRGFEVAVAGDGLIVRPPGFNDDLIPRQGVGGASIKQVPENKPQIASVVLRDKHKHLSIGGVCNVFPQRADVERFVGQVNDRVRAADGGG